MGVWNGLCQVRIHTLLNGPCKCRDGTCFANINKTEAVEFLDQFEKRTKLEQDAILFLACSDPLKRGRNEYAFLGKQMRRACWEQLMGISSHRVDKIGAVDQRYGSRGGWKQSPLTSSIDSFCMVLYNSIAEPLPTKFLECCLLRVLGFHVPRFCQFKAVQFCKPRLVRLGPAKRHTAIVPNQKSDTDHWNGGVDIKSDFEENDEDLADFLKANTAFILQMSSTNAFTVPLFNGMFLFVF